MITKGIYAGSFNPWHVGHMDILEKALTVFDKVVVACGVNPEKASIEGITNNTIKVPRKLAEFKPDRVQYVSYSILLVRYIEAYNSKYSQEPITAVIRGLRSGYDVDYEQTLQYWNEDLGIEVPTVFFISDRRWSHISSSAIRQIKTFDQNITLNV